MTQVAACRYNGAMRHFALLLLLAATLAACGNLPIGPVNHSCPGNPMRSQGSGCEDNHND